MNPLAPIASVPLLIPVITTTVAASIHVTITSGLSGVAVTLDTSWTGITRLAMVSTISLYKQTCWPS